MRVHGAKPRGRLFWALGLLVTLVVAGGLSYLASSRPDGLESTTLRGCEVVKRNGTEELTGNCIAQSATKHAMSDSPLAGYSVAGAAGTAGLAGVIGVLLTLAAAGCVFRAIGRGSARSPDRN